MGQQAPDSPTMPSIDSQPNPETLPSNPFWRQRTAVCAVFALLLLLVLVIAILNSSSIVETAIVIMPADHSEGAIEDARQAVEDAFQASFSCSKHEKASDETDLPSNLLDLRESGVRLMIALSDHGTFRPVDDMYQSDMAVSNAHNESLALLHFECHEEGSWLSRVSCLYCWFGLLLLVVIFWMAYRFGPLQIRPRCLKRQPWHGPAQKLPRVQFWNHTCRNNHSKKKRIAYLLYGSSEFEGDCEAMDNALQQCGFEVERCTSHSKRDLKVEHFQQWGSKLKASTQADEEGVVALFYATGHGREDSDGVHLMASANSEHEININLSALWEDLARSLPPKSLVIIIIDACRTRSRSRANSLRSVGDEMETTQDARLLQVGSTRMFKVGRGDLDFFVAFSGLYGTESFSQSDRRPSQQDPYAVTERPARALSVFTKAITDVCRSPNAVGLNLSDFFLNVTGQMQLKGQMPQISMSAAHGKFVFRPARPDHPRLDGLDEEPDSDSDIRVESNRHPPSGRCNRALRNPTRRSSVYRAPGPAELSSSTGSYDREADSGAGIDWSEGADSRTHSSDSQRSRKSRDIHRRQSVCSHCSCLGRSRSGGSSASREARTPVTAWSGSRRTSVASSAKSPRGVEAGADAGSDPDRMARHRRQQRPEHPPAHHLHRSSSAAPVLFAAASRLRGHESRHTSPQASRRQSVSLQADLMESGRVHGSDFVFEVGRRGSAASIREQVLEASVRRKGQLEEEWRGELELQQALGVPVNQRIVNSVLC